MSIDQDRLEAYLVLCPIRKLHFVSTSGLVNVQPQLLQLCLWPAFAASASNYTYRPISDDEPREGTI